MPGEDIKYTGIGVKDSCELPCGFWGNLLGSMVKQQVLLGPELPIQSQEKVFLLLVFETVFFPV